MGIGRIDTWNGAGLRSAESGRAECVRSNARRVYEESHVHEGFNRRKRPTALPAIVAGCALSLAVAAPAMAADTVAPVIAPAAFSAPPNGNANWRITAPQTLNLSATDDVAVSKFQYSLDGGATYIDVPVTAGPTATASVPLSQQGNTTVRYRAVDSSGNFSRGATANTTLGAASAAGATGVRLASTTGRGVGDSLLIDTGAGQETATIATIVTPAPAAPAPNVTLAAPLANAHASGVAVAGTQLYNTIAALIDTNGPVAIWGTSPTTIQPNNATAGAPAAKIGDTGIRLASVTGRAAGDTLQLDRGPNAEIVKIASVDTTAPAAPAPNVTLTTALTKNHINGASVYLPQVVDGKILQSQTLTPSFADPRLQDPTDTVSTGAGGSAPRMMTLDGTQIIAKNLAVNTLTAGKHADDPVAPGQRRQHVEVHEQLRGHDLVRRPLDRDRPALELRAVEHDSTPRRRSARWACGSPMRRQVTRAPSLPGPASRSSSTQAPTRRRRRSPRRSARRPRT